MRNPAPEGNPLGGCYGILLPGSPWLLIQCLRKWSTARRAQSPGGEGGRSTLHPLLSVWSAMCTLKHGSHLLRGSDTRMHPRCTLVNQRVNRYSLHSPRTVHPALNPLNGTSPASELETAPSSSPQTHSGSFLVLLSLTRFPAFLPQLTPTWL